MKQYFGLGLAMLAGAVLGAVAVTGLHAQAKPPVYLVTEIDVTPITSLRKSLGAEGSGHHKSGGRPLSRLRSSRRSRSKIGDADRRRGAIAHCHSDLG